MYILGRKSSIHLIAYSTGCFQEQIRAWFHNQTKINWGPNEKLNYTSNNRPYQISSNPKTLKNKTALNE